MCLHLTVNYAMDKILHVTASVEMLAWYLSASSGRSMHMVTVTVTGTAGVKESLLGLDSWIAAAEEVSLQTASGGGKRRCRRDVQLMPLPPRHVLLH